MRSTCSINNEMESLMALVWLGLKLGLEVCMDPPSSVKPFMGSDSEAAASICM